MRIVVKKYELIQVIVDFYRYISKLSLTAAIHVPLFTFTNKNSIVLLLCITTVLIQIRKRSKYRGSKHSHLIFELSEAGMVRIGIILLKV